MNPLTSVTLSVPHRQPPAIFLMGPTAAGKTDLAVHLVENLPCDIISVDSAMVYRGMDIGTAKPDAALLKRAPHRLIDIRDPSEPYSAAQFRDDALREMRAITATGRVPLLVGGTMLYFRALQHGLSAMPSADPALRAQLADEADAIGWQAMHRRLAELDPVAAQRIHPNDPQRIQRALEVCLLSGRSMSDLHGPDDTGGLPYRVLKIALAPADRAILHQRIETRFKLMLEAGLLNEVRALYERGDLDPGLPALRAVGYRQVWAFLAKKTTYPEMVQRALIATRQLAKRQMTWLRSEADVHWLDSRDSDAPAAALSISARLVV